MINLMKAFSDEVVKISEAKAIKQVIKDRKDKRKDDMKIDYGGISGETLSGT